MLGCVLVFVFFLPTLYFVFGGPGGTGEGAGCLLCGVGASALRHLPGLSSMAVQLSVPTKGSVLTSARSLVRVAVPEAEPSVSPEAWF